MEKRKKWIKILSVIGLIIVAAVYVISYIFKIETINTWLGLVAITIFVIDISVIGALYLKEISNKKSALYYIVLIGIIIVNLVLLLAFIKLLLNGGVING